MTTPWQDKTASTESQQLMRMAEPASAQTLARLLGKMNSMKCVIPPAPLFYRNLQMTPADQLPKLRGHTDSRQPSWKS